MNMLMYYIMYFVKNPQNNVMLALPFERMADTQLLVNKILNKASGWGST